VAIAQAGSDELPRFASCVQAFEREFDYLYRAAERLGVTGADAEDLVQDVFVVMWRRWDDYRRDRPLRPWMVGIAAHLAQSHRRRRLREVPAAELDITDEQPLAEERLSAAAARTLVMRALARLPARHRSPLVLHEIEGLSIQEISRLLSIPLSTVYTRVRRARVAFATAVKKLQARAGAEALFELPALLHGERSPAPAPAGARERSLARVRGLAAGPALPFPVAPAARPAGPWLLGGLAASALVLSTVLAAVMAPPARRLASARRTAPVALAVVAPVGGLARGLVGYWRFDDPGSAVARDLSRSGNDCRVRGRLARRAAVDGPLDTAVRLAGVWLDCRRPALAAAGGAEMTAAAWIRPFKKGKFHGALIAQQRGQGWDKDLMFSVIDDHLEVTSIPWDVTVRRPLAAVGRWVHVAFTRERNGTVRLFIGGALAGEASGGSGAAVDDAPVGKLTMGATITSADGREIDQRFYGSMDEVLIYDRALGEQEIAALAQGQQPEI
jgi:RNA polymerase sigma-70 factor (ECF subfamily)